MTGTTQPPRWDSTDWEFEEGYPFLKLEWIGEENSVDEADPEITLAVRATLYNQDLTYEGVILWEWTRESWFDNVQDTTSDNLWNSAHDCVSNSLDLTILDMNYHFGKHPDKLIFRVTATVIEDNGLPMEKAGQPMQTYMTIEV